jgi:GNAT superfamily N-acetyltransferase
MAGAASDGRAGIGARPIDAADRATVSTMLARAFAEDPVMMFMFPDPADRLRKLPRLFGLLLDSALPFGGCDVTTGGETAGLWRPPGKTDIPLREILRHLAALLSIYGFRGAARALRFLAILERHHPIEPHWYLMVLGTDPHRQGKGFGGIALRHRLARIDAAHQPAYLEASKRENVPIYAAFGFEPQGELAIPHGPVIYPMWRPER